MMSVHEHMHERTGEKQQIGKRPEEMRAMREFGWRSDSSGGFLIGRDFDSVTEFYTGDNLRQQLLSLQPAPAFRRLHHQLEHHQARRVLRERAFRAHSSAPHRRNGALDRIRRAQMRPMLGRKIEERQQSVAVLRQAIDGDGIFRRKFLGENIDRRLRRRPVRRKPDLA
jgi:hypothetical protein